MAEKYYKCEHCTEFFPSNKGRKYCTRRCRDAAFYQRKKLKQTQI